MRRESIGSRRRSSLQINHQIVAFGRLNARTGEAIRSTDRTEALMQTSYRPKRLCTQLPGDCYPAHSFSWGRMIQPYDLVTALDLNNGLAL
jgi:hypothetical protein